MSLSCAQVEHVSLLARLLLDPDELDAMTRQLDKVVRYVEQLGALDTQSVEPLAHALDLTNVFAADEPSPSLDRQLALANAPKQDGASYLVPAVLDR